jgi:AGCS family alanine or glycine:cation symporter
LGWLFAFFAFLASVGIGNMVQSNSVAAAVNNQLGVPMWITGVVLAIAVGAVIIGGIKSIARVAEAIVPVMAVIYVIGSLIIIFINFGCSVRRFGWIFGNAFTGKAVGGGLLGSVIRFGVARGIFSNEAGLGSAPIAHAASQTNDPVRQGIIAQPRLVHRYDRYLYDDRPRYPHQQRPDDARRRHGDPRRPQRCGTHHRGVPRAAPRFRWICRQLWSRLLRVPTMLTWYFYGFKCLEYITNRKFAEQFKWVWVVLSFVGAIASLSFVWNLSGRVQRSDGNPQPRGLIALSPVVFAALKEYEGKSLN